ncbi:aminoglycoside 6'-acetyltransferase (plasmid) [Azospirillum argentinense]|uniref:Aminoglycoside N(6')-acetyltransferase type 1 n=1 Tax=Azospirillum argentinense TaxID=2970906 RepID=A0A060DSY6_9PROT|nr:aminoglycoside 6'-N-acetyltransferase [Azospirillum argentinense]AIB15810.1 aminoglycoside 6'-acetyltransferase [Azospirillum argentinense]EZQ03307.1 aminoglycoside 6'-acetyltransferase [Azospirillum argentinense]PNQ95867.1 N-acetyltransferase [Azospirillum argentinense]
MRVERCTHETLDDLATLRWELWPEAPIATHHTEAAEDLSAPDRAIAFIVRDEDGVAVGFAEASLRRDYVNGCETSPVAFLEGIYVRAEQRKRGVARLLIQAVEGWGKEKGCSEFASDADIGNDVSRRMHAALGFEETERVVFFRKSL